MIIISLTLITSIIITIIIIIAGPSGAVGYVLRTGLSTTQGELVRTIMVAADRVTVNTTDTLIFLGILFCFSGLFFHSPMDRWIHCVVSVIVFVIHLVHGRLQFIVLIFFSVFVYCSPDQCFLFVSWFIHLFIHSFIPLCTCFLWTNGWTNGWMDSRGRGLCRQRRPERSESLSI